MQQRLAELSRALTQEGLSEEDEDIILDEIEEIENEMDHELNLHDNNEEY